MLSWLPASFLAWASKRAVAKWVEEAASGPRDAVEAVAEQRRAMFDSGAVSKASLLANADVLVDFFSRSFAPCAAEVLIIEAGQDRMVDAAEREALRRLYPNARVHRLVGDDHFSAVLAPQSLTSVIREFLVVR